MTILTVEILVGVLLVGIIGYLLRSVSKLKKQFNALKKATTISSLKELKDLCKRYRFTDEEIEAIVNIYNFHININSLHNNQKMLSSSVRELYRALRKYDKNFRRQIGSKEKGTEEA